MIYYEKSIVLTFLLFGIIGFSRFVERCEITSKGITRSGVSYVNCISLESGKNFNFTRVDRYTRNDLHIGNVYTVYFEGSGYNRLNLTGYEYLY